MAQQEAVRIYGVRQNAAGIRVIERSGSNALTDPNYGVLGFSGILKRGPMGIPFPLNSQRQYHDICGDPKNPLWHLYGDSSQLTPDAIDGYWSTSNGAGQLWLIRLDLDGNARPAEVMLRGRTGAPALRVKAANAGRWGGQGQTIPYSPIVYATMTSFTLVRHGTLQNEFAGAVASPDNGSGKAYVVVANTAADPVSGEVVFAIGAQYNLVGDGISGFVTLTGTATYARYNTLTGTVAYTPLKPLTGTISVTGRTLTGQGSEFTSELFVGSTVYLNGEARTIDSITNDTTATVTAPYSSDGSGTFQTDSTTLTGTTTTFQADLTAGQTIYVEVEGVRVPRTVLSITSDTSLELTSGFTTAISASTVQIDNLTVTGLTSEYLTELQPGSYVVDPNREGAPLRVISVTSDTSFTVEAPFSASFAAAQITKQSLRMQVVLEQPANTGLGVIVGQGVRFPATHFSLSVIFNGSVIYSVNDASLDPNDPYFVEPLVNDDGNNIAYRTGSQNYQKWITVESLWESAYTTNPIADVRPCNGTGIILHLTKTRLYTVGDFDYNAAIGQLLYPNPYEVARSFVRVTGSVAPLSLSGTFSTLGVSVTGVASQFLSELSIGDYLYDPVSGTARKIILVASDTVATLESPFPSNVPALTQGQRSGYLEISQGYDLTALAAVGDRFLIAYPTPLAAGYDGNVSALIPYYWTKFFGADDSPIPQTMFGRNVGLVRWACPGVSDPAIQKAGAAWAEAYAYEFRAEIPSNYLDAASAEAFLNQMLGRNDFQVAAFPSYGFVSDPFGNGDRFIPLSGDIMGGESLAAQTAQGYHQPFAGVNAALPRVLKLPIGMTPNDEAILNIAGIQPIKFMFGNAVVFGARSNSISDLYTFIHIRRTQSNYIRVFLEARELLQQLFRPNQPATVDQILMVLEAWARKEYAKGVFSNYLSIQQAVEIEGGLATSGIVTDQATQLALVEIINGQLQIYISYVPTGIIEQISMNLSPTIVTSQYGNALSSSTV